MAKNIIPSKETIILGIDPGTKTTGFGIISSKDDQAELILIDELNLNPYQSHYLRLKKIFEKTISIIDQYYPDEISIEAPFFGKNIQSMLKLGRAQGVAMAACLSREISVIEYSPRKIKQSITGNGNASKEQVAFMLETILKLKPFSFPSLDASDGLAAAICHHLNKRSLKNDLPFTKKNSWDLFIKENPDRIKEK